MRKCLENAACDEKKKATRKFVKDALKM